jgi:hypothetical protein
MTKTLLQRAEPEFLAGLKANEAKWKDSTDRLYKVLETNILWSDLKINDVSSLIIFSDLPFAKVTKETWKYGENIVKPLWK